MLEKINRIILLYDFYGQLLTERQRKFIDLHFGQDFSLGEIAEEFHVSRQAVHDAVKRAIITLEGYEEKLGLLGKFLTQRTKLSKAAKLLANYETSGEKQLLQQVAAIINDVITLEQR